MATGYQPDSPRDISSIVAAGSLLTAEDYFARCGEWGRSELVMGEVRTMSPSNFGHGYVVGRLDRLLGAYVESNRLGAVVPGDVGFVLARNPDTVLAPDIAFLSTSRLPEDRWFKFFEGAPDLVVEVVSPDDRKKEVSAKAIKWVQAGARIVWIANPMTEQVTVYRPGQPASVVEKGGVLDGGDVLPGFSCPVVQIFDLP